MPIERITVESGEQPCVRDTKIKFWDVYRDLAGHGLSDDAVLQKHPELEPEDLAAVREYAVHLINTRTHDEITGRLILPKEVLKDGRYYKGRCRNATIARWNTGEECFYHWREKFGRVFVEKIKYPTDEVEPWWDVFDVVEELSDSKFEIPFDADAVFSGNRDDLFEYNSEMWSRSE